MGAALAQNLARRGFRLGLVARRAEELARVAAEINASDGTQAFIYPHDVRNYDAIPVLFQSIVRQLGGLDLIVYAAGIMPQVAPNEYDFEKDKDILEVNLLGAIAWLNQAAVRFDRAQAGHIVAISSVAGDRGRSGNPAYCTSKAALNTYLESLRNRLGRKGVAVTTLKPGPIDTPMTQGKPVAGRVTSIDQATAQIVAAIDRRANEAYIPQQWKFIMYVIRRIPSVIFQRLNI
ncbi:MAG: SDR family NAD(P)-dependent oxidoreductase [Chloroflexi bacterium]|nr:SDR family NAD(P)-dependent oxidoreductase [Chloroflexota bacterium]